MAGSFPSLANEGETRPRQEKRPDIRLDRNSVLRGELAEVRERPRADMLDDLGRRKGAQPRAGFEVLAFAEPGEKSSREEIASSRRVDNPVDWERGHGANLVARNDDRSPLGAGDDTEDIFGAQVGGGGVEFAGSIKRMQLALVGENDLHRARANEPKQLFAVPIDAKGIGQG